MERESFGNRLFTLICAWFVTIGFDFFLHGGLLARIYTQESPFLLSAENAFLRIPLGYLSFLILCALLMWLIYLADIRGRKNGFIFGLKFGAVAWGAFALGLYSISTAGIPLLVGWWLGQSIELALAGFVIGIRQEGMTKLKLAVWVVGFVLMMAVLTIALQVAGFAPPMKTV